MSVDIKRKGNESNESLLRRFQDKMKRSRLLISAKKSRYFAKKKNSRQIKGDALRRKEKREKRDFLIKVGKLPELTQTNNFRKS